MRLIPTAYAVGIFTDFCVLQKRGYYGIIHWFE